MGVYVMLTKLTEKGRKVVKENPERIDAVNKRVESLGVNILSQYALFGPYDFVNILKADNDEVVMKVAIDLTASGKMEILTLTAVHIDTFIEQMKRLSAE
ncbi:MAG TPA: GYD domain-containing protein [Methanomicrobia archaeon]|nr:GYD domain-containing protein [Methanomicrobia archaeon]